MEVILSKRFIKQAKKLGENKKHLRNKIDDGIIDFSRHVRKSKYYRKALKGNYFGFEELQIGGDIRILIRIRMKNNIAVFEQIGTHSQLGL